MGAFQGKKNPLLTKKTTKARLTFAYKHLGKILCRLMREKLNLLEDFSLEDLPPSQTWWW